MEVLKRFGFYSQQKLQVSKCHGLCKGPNREGVQSLLEEFDIKLRPHARYLGIKLGDISPQVALPSGMVEAMRRACLIYGLQLTLGERVTLLKIYVLPVVAWGAQAYFPTPGTISYLGVAHKTALCLASWCLTLPILCKPVQLGELSLCPPSSFLLQLVAALFLFCM